MRLGISLGDDDSQAFPPGRRVGIEMEYTYEASGGGVEVVIYHGGRWARTLRGDAAMSLFRHLSWLRYQSAGKIVTSSCDALVQEYLHKAANRVLCESGQES